MTIHLQPDELHKYEQDYVGKTARVDVPLKSVVALRRVAEELRGLAARLEFLSHERNERPPVVMLEARAAIRQCNRKMAALRGPGRPKKHPTLDGRTVTEVKRKSRKPADTHKM